MNSPNLSGTRFEMLQLGIEEKKDHMKPDIIKNSQKNEHADKGISLKFIYDNTTYKESFQSGWGFSCLIDGRILFDTGEAPDSLLHNMDQFGVHPSVIEAVVISHNHWDHTGGLWELLKQRPGLPVFGCPGFGDEFRKNVFAFKGNLVESLTFRKIDSKIAVTGEIPGQYKGTPMPEQALTIKSKQGGLTVITGCSHPGILTIVQKVKEKFPNEVIHLVLGGFHLMDKEPQTIKLIVKSMKELGVENVGPTHCTGDVAKSIFREMFGKQVFDIQAGKEIKVL
ncbi:MBL fold metallo-hydrolase [candidate division KSB1 bacterium]|nr:MBL fold metallo-hydrolase [candidate division KSB1 bacterium]